MVPKSENQEQRSKEAVPRPLPLRLSRHTGFTSAPPLSLQRYPHRKSVAELPIPGSDPDPCRQERETIREEYLIYQRSPIAKPCGRTNDHPFLCLHPSVRIKSSRHNRTDRAEHPGEEYQAQASRCRSAPRAEAIREGGASRICESQILFRVFFVSVGCGEIQDPGVGCLCAKFTYCARVVCLG